MPESAVALEEIADARWAPTAPARRRPSRPWLFLSLLAVLSIFGYEFCRVYFGPNVHTVVPGQVYRTAQPSPESLEGLVHEYGIRTVINLRGNGYPGDWYIDQCRTVRDLNISQEDVNFSANRIPSATELRRLVEILDRTEYPILFHCRRGADRTGMASTIALLLRSDVALADARRQLGPRFGHIRIAKTRILDHFFDLYEEWLAKTGQRHDAGLFRQWILSEYDGEGCAYALEEFSPLQEVVRKGEPSGFRVRLRNTSRCIWHIRAGVFAGTHLGFEIFGPAGQFMMGRAGKVDCDIPPGEVWDLKLVLPPIDAPGKYRLLIDMIHENQCWFFQAGADPHEEELLVRE